MGIRRCGCRATFRAFVPIELTSDSERTFGNLTADINICPDCTPGSSSISLEFDNISGPISTFFFNTITGGVGLPDCENGSLTVNAEGTFTGNVEGEAFENEEATLELSLNDLTNEICITISVGDHIITGCNIGSAEFDIDNC